MKTEYRLATGEQLTEEELKYWYDQDIEGFEDYIKNMVTMSADNTRIIHGIPVTLLQSFASFSMEISGRTLRAVLSAKDVYYRYFVVKQLVDKNKTERASSKLKIKNLKRAQKKLIKRIRK